MKKETEIKLRKLIERVLREETTQSIDKNDKLRQSLNKVTNRILNQSNYDDLAMELLDFAGGDLEDTYDWPKLYAKFFEERNIDPKSKEAEKIYDLALSKLYQP